MSKVKLGDVAVEVRETVKDATGVPVVGLEHLVPGEIELSQWAEDNDNTFNKVFRKGQILFGRRRAYQKKASVATIDGVCSGDITVIAAKEDRILPELLPFIVNDDRFFDYAMEKSAGSLSPRVKWAQLAEYEFELPEDTAKQSELASLLWSIERNRKAYKVLLNQTDDLVKSQFVEMFGDPIDNPKGFPVFRMDEVVRFEGGSQPERKYFEFTPREGTIRLIQIRDYKTDRYVTYIPKELAKRFCTADDIMIGRYGPPIFQILKGIEGAYNVALMKAVPLQGRKEYIRQFLKQDCLLKYLESLSTRTAGQDGISMDALKAYPFPMPPEELQDWFITFAAEIDKSKFEANKALKSLAAMQKAIIGSI